MKAEIDSMGRVALTPETTTEAYALSKWRAETWVTQADTARAESGHWRGSRLTIVPLELRPPPGSLQRFSAPPDRREIWRT